MKINPFYVSKNNYNLMSSVHFKAGKNYPSGYYTDEEIADAKKYLGVDNWETSIQQDFFKRDNYTWKEWWITNQNDKDAEARIREVRKLMIDLNNEKLAQIQKEKRELVQKAENEELEAKFKSILMKKCANLLPNKNTNNNLAIPSAILIEGGSQAERTKTINWLRLQTDNRKQSFKLPDNEDDALYRLETEIQYAKEHYDTSRQRTMLFVENFAGILDSKKSSAETIGDLKAIMTSLSKDKIPVTIVFETTNSNNIDDAFMKNNTRIPLKINLENLMQEKPVNPKKASLETYADGNKRDWRKDLEIKYKNMPAWKLEVEKSSLSNKVEEHIKNKDYEKVIVLKDKIALICAMQGKSRDNYLLRVDIEKYLDLL